MATTPTPSSSNAADTRQAIFEAAVRLFADSGYDGTSIRDIVQAAGVTKPVLYYYFDSKEHLFYSIIKEKGEQFLSNIREIVEKSGDFHERFRELVGYYIDCSRREEDMLRLFFSTGFAPRKQAAMMDLRETLLDDCPTEDPHLKLLEGFLQEGIDQGEIRKAPLDILIRFVLGPVVVYMHERAGDGRIPPDNVEQTIYELLLSGIGGKR